MAAKHNHFGADEITKSEVMKPLVDMNVTPFIDVLLVMLVLFMFQIAHSQKGMDINLPLETRSQEASAVSDQVVIQFSANRRLQINQQDVSLAQLENQLRNIFETRAEKQVFIIGDGKLPYGEVIQVIDAARGAGIERVGIVTDGMRAAAAQAAAAAPGGR